jgi:hypothetical protein
MFLCDKNLFASQHRIYVIQRNISFGFEYTPKVLITNEPIAVVYAGTRLQIFPQDVDRHS